MFPDLTDKETLWTLLIIPFAVQWWSSWYPGAEPGGGGYIAQRMLAAKNENHAIDLANDTPFGLGAAVFTDDTIKGKEIAKKRLNAGMCFVNDFVKSDPRLPFGGVKQSGYGRELSIYGMMEFVNIKTVVIHND